MFPDRSLRSQTFFLNPGHMSCPKWRGACLVSDWGDPHPRVLLPKAGTPPYLGLISCRAQAPLRGSWEAPMPVSEGSVPEQCKRESSHVMGVIAPHLQSVHLLYS